MSDLHHLMGAVFYTTGTACLLIFMVPWVRDAARKITGWWDDAG